MTSRQKVVVGLLCGATIIGGAAWAEPLDRGAVTGQAAETPSVVALMDAARLEPLVGVVATEGARHAMGLEASLFPGRGGEAWAEIVSAIQAPDRMSQMLAETMASELPSDVMSEALAFYDTDLGAKVAEREVASRRAMLDAEVEARAMRAASADAVDDRAELLDDLIDSLGLIEANVSGGLNANYAFYRGLGDGGALSKRLTEREMLAMVWGQEPEVRESMDRWLRAYLTLAYEPLSDDELRDYVAFSSTAPGRKMSAALFAGFGRVFEETSYDLGRAAARFIAMQDA